MNRRVLRVILLLMAALALLGTGDRAALGRPLIQQSMALAPLPARWPYGMLQLGMSDAPGGAAAMKVVAPFGFRYTYLAGGVNTGNGWATWNPDGAFVTYYIQESVASGITPVFSYYQLRQSAPGNGQTNDGAADLANLQNAATMTAYYKDLELFFQRAAAASPTAPVLLQMEPDLWGFLQQQATGDDAASVPAQVASTGLPELAGLPNTAAGFAQAVLKLRNLYAPNVLVGYHVSTWGTGMDILLSKPDDITVQTLAARAAAFEQSLHAPFDVAFSEFLDRDSAFYQYQYNDGGAHWYQQADYARHLLFMSTFSTGSGLRLLLWQIPYGNTRMDTENNTWGHYQSNQVESLLGDPTDILLDQYVNGGVIALLFGGGAAGTTCACDADNDGVVDFAPINGNTQPALNADDDGGYFKQQAAAYYSGGGVAVPGASAPSTGAGLAPAASSALPTPTPAPPAPSPGDQTAQANPFNGPLPFATAQCNDGWFSFNRQTLATCQAHGGVMIWIVPPGSACQVAASRAQASGTMASRLPAC